MGMLYDVSCSYFIENKELYNKTCILFTTFVLNYIVFINVIHHFSLLDSIIYKDRFCA